MKNKIIHNIIVMLDDCDLLTLKAIEGTIQQLYERNHNHGRKEARNNIIHFQLHQFKNH